jgi:predicted chitinase
MASKKKRGQQQDMEWDADLDFDIPDFDGGNLDATTDNRKPITKGLKSAAEGFGKTFTSEARLRKTLTKSLPREYEEPISKAFEVKNGVRDLYNIAGSEVSETVRETKRSVNRIAKNLESTIPKGVFDKLMRMTSESDSGDSGRASKEEIENGTINDAFAGIFAETTKAEAENRKKDQARAIVQDTIDKKRHADMTTILGSIDQSLISMQTHQEKVGINFMKKSLEIQFRTYFVQNDMLQLQTKFFQEFKNEMAAITKNTGLPDYVKKAPKEALLERLREKTFDSLSNSIASRRSKWLNGVFEKTGKKIKEVGSGIRDGAGQILDVVEMASSMQGSGMGPTPAEMAGDLAGGWAGNKAQDYISAKIKGKMLRNPNMVKRGNKFAQIAGNLPQWVNKQAMNGKYADKIPDWLKDILAEETEGSNVNMNREVDLERAAQFSDKNSRSLNVVIPELLAKIQNELYITRTGDVNAKPLAYDHDKGKFVTSKERQQRLATTLVGKKTVENTQRQLDNLFEEIDPEKTLDKKERDAISEKIYAANKKGEMFDLQGMMNSTGNDKAADLIRSHVEKDSTGGRERRIGNLFGKVGENNGEVKSLIQALVDSGRHGELQDLGVLNANGSINLDMVRKMELGQYELPGSGPAAPNAPGALPPGGRGPNRPFSPMGGRQGGFLNLDAFTRNRNQNQPATPAGASPASMEDFTKVFREAMQGVNGLRGSGAVSEDLGEKLTKAIETAGGKSELVEIRDILARIEEKGLGGGIMTPEMLEQYMGQKFGGYFGKAGSAFGKAASKLGGMAKSSFMGSLGAGKKIGKAMFGAGSGALSWLGEQKDKFDLYIGNEVEPRLNKAKLEAGRYVDAATGKVIMKFEDIKGDIKDLDTDKIVLRASELKESILKNLETGKSVAVRLTGWGKKAIGFSIDSIKKTAEKVLGLGKTVYGMGWTAVKKAYSFLTDGAMDVYLKDNYETPVLLKRVMEQGLYFDKATLDPITKVSDIKGAVVDNDEDVVITKEDLANGLYDKNGQEIKTGFDRITQFVGNSIKKTIGTYKNILGKGMDMGKRAMAWVKGLFGFDSPFTVFSQRTNDILVSIYNLLNDRMPGEKSPDLDTIAKKASGGDETAGGGKSEGSFTKAFKKARGKAKDLKDEHWEKARDDVYARTGRTKDKAKEGWEKLYSLMDERLPEAKKKVFGDLNGDGIRDGSIDDLRTKRQKLKDKATGALGGVGDKVKGMSAYSAIADFFKKREKKEEAEKAEEEDDGFGLDDALEAGADGLGGEDGPDRPDPNETPEQARERKKQRRLARARRNRPARSGMRGVWDKVKGKMTPRGGMGRGLMGAAKFGGRAALAWGGSLLGGGALSASLLGSGLSMLGTALGMTATAAAAILSSPITVPLLAAAAIGTAGYFAYKWMTKPDPQPIEKVRLVQYGFQASDIDAYKKMKQLEMKVAGATTFKGDNAEFDPKKINIQEMMKIFGLDASNQDHAKKFIDWFANRFRPVYLHHRALIKIVASPKELENVDDNKPELKQSYLDQCLFPGEHYGIKTNPNKDVPYLFTSQGTVERAIENAKEEVKKEGTKKEEKKAPLSSGVGMAAAAKAAEAKKALDDEKKKDSAKPQGAPMKNTGNTEQLSKMNRLAAATAGSAMGPGGPGNPVGSPAGPNGEAGSPPKSKGDVKPKSGDAAVVRAALIKNMAKYGVTSQNQKAALLGNVEHESGFQPISENLNYKPATLMKLWPNRFPTMQSAQEVASKGPQGIANSIYGGRMGNVDANDGWDYRGRGPIQITGKSNYAAISKVMGKDIVNDPDKLVTDPQTSAESALAYWKMNPALGKYADAGNFTKVRQLLNGGNIGLEDANANVREYLSKIQSGELDANGVAASPSSSGGSVMVASPKPTTPNTVENNPNAGPTPSTYSSKPAQMVASPRPSYDPTSASSAPAMAPVRSGSQDAYYQSKSSVNTGDSMEIMKKSVTELETHTGILNRIAESLDDLPEKLAKLIGATAPEATPAPAESNNYNKPPVPLASPSVSFRRKLAGD